jgi:hypothetical protein
MTTLAYSFFDMQNIRLEQLVTTKILYCCYLLMQFYCSLFLTSLLCYQNAASMDGP